MALTATATPRVRRDIVSVLRLRRPLMFVGSFDRPNLSWTVEAAAGHTEKIRALRRHVSPGSGALIVYAGTRRTVEAVRRELARLGTGALAYHAGLSGDERSSVQETFMSGRARVVVATNAFGMGIDKPDVRTVLHYQLSGTLEGYYQEAGRGGRDGEPAACVALHGPEDLRLHRRFVDRARPDPGVVARVWRRLVGRSREATAGSMDLGRGFQRLKPEAVKAALEWMEREGHVCASPAAGSGRGDPQRQDRQTQWLPIDRDATPDLTRLGDLRAAALDGLAAVERYASTGSCRREALLDYFGERLGEERCGSCDLCVHRSPGAHRAL